MSKLDEVIFAGKQMSNVMFNLSQRGDGLSNIHLAANEYGPFKKLYEQWDAAVKKYQYRAKPKQAKRKRERKKP